MAENYSGSLQSGAVIGIGPNGLIGIKQGGYFSGHGRGRKYVKGKFIVGRIRRMKDGDCILSRTGDEEYRRMVLEEYARWPLTRGAAKFDWEAAFQLVEAA